MKITTLQEAFVNELSDTYNSEKQITKALPKMAAAASNPDLSAAFTQHLAETKTQIEKIEQAAKSAGIKLEGEKCEATEGLIKEGDEVIENTEKGAVRDVLLIACGQKVEHYEIASYGTLVELATLLGYEEAAGLLQEILDQETETDEKLSELAQGGINDEALEMQEAA